ncbi:MAG TPA: hypothetical protein VH186_19640 [Chloroflexia bacterium]|nr:hypothetical protein [Chloroflexia bacterium]
MENQAKNSNSNLIIGMLIGSVAGLALGALVTNLANRLLGKAWTKVTHRNDSNRVDPRWLLQ